MRHLYDFISLGNKSEDMAYSDYVLERVKQYLPSQLSMEWKKMMGGIILMVNGKMCLGIDIDKHNGQDRLMLRVGKQAYEDLLTRPACREMDFTGKAMKGFVFVYPEGYDAEADLAFWVSKALEFNKLIK